ncbi:PadR family transcriptional regulator [Arthrobacter sp. HLT1-20]
MKFDDILLMLIAAEPGTGYDMRRRLSTEGVFIRANVDQSQIYRTLARLQRAGMVDFVEEKRENAPNAKVYSLTPTGIVYLQEFTELDYVPAERWQEADFGAQYQCRMWLNPTAVPRMLEIELSFRRQQIAKYRNRDRTIRVNNPAFDIDQDLIKEFRNNSHEFGARSMDQWVDWVESQLKVWKQRLAERS